MKKREPQRYLKAGRSRQRGKKCKGHDLRVFQYVHERARRLLLLAVIERKGQSDKMDSHKVGVRAYGTLWTTIRTQYHGVILLCCEMEIKWRLLSRKVIRSVVLPIKIGGCHIVSVLYPITVMSTRCPQAKCCLAFFFFHAIYNLTSKAKHQKQSSKHMITHPFTHTLRKSTSLPRHCHLGQAAVGLRHLGVSIRQNEKDEDVGWRENFSLPRVTEQSQWIQSQTFPGKKIGL